MSARLKLKRINDRIYGVMKMAHQLSVKLSEALAEYIRFNLNISDVPEFPNNRIKVELIAPRMNESNVRIVTAKNRHAPYNDWRKI